MYFISFLPLAGMEDVVLLLVRLILGGTMIYFGWPKISDLRQNAEDTAKMGFKPGAFWGFIIAFTEFFGSLMVILGFYAWIGAALIGFQMLVGTIWKITKAKKPFPDYSYDILLVGLALVILTYGAGSISLAGLL